MNPIPRFGATDEQTAKEHRRKKLSTQLVRSHAASLAPYLQRSTKTLAARPLAEQQVGEEIAAAAERIHQKQASQDRQRRQMARVEVPEEFQRAGIAMPETRRSGEDMSEAEMNEILTGGASHPLIAKK